MVKKSVLFTTLLFVLLLSLFAGETPAYPFQVIGYINKDFLISVVLDSTVIPFDLESSTVKRNTDRTIVRGLGIGTYSIRSNSKFKLTVTHDKLVCNNPSVGSTRNIEADYRLDLFYKNQATAFKSCVAVATEDFPSTSIVIDYNDISTTSLVFSISGMSMFVSMTDTPTALSALEPGMYSSTITFTLEGST